MAVLACDFWSNSMYPDLQKELSTYERRTPKSAEAHKKNLKRLPLGVARITALMILIPSLSKTPAAANSATSTATNTSITT